MIKPFFTTLFLIAGQLSAGVESVGTTSANFLKIPPHARAAAMGEAFAAVSDDETALLYNPAGTANILQNQISATHIEWFQGIKLEHLGGVFGLGPLGSVGASLTWLQIEPLIKTERIANSGNPLANYREIGSFSPHDMNLNFSYARMVRDRMTVGAGLRVIQQAIDDRQGWAGALDLGGQYFGLAEGLVLGLHVRNLGSAVSVGGTAFQLPLDFTGGLAYRFSGFPLLLTSDIGFPSDNAMMIGVGAEATVYKVLSLRGGWRGGFASQLTAGAGFRITDFGLDYAWAPFTELGNTHRITASYSFGRPPLGLSIERPLIAPIGDPDKRLTAYLPRLTQSDRVMDWTLSIRSSNGAEVRKMSGSGPIPARLAWDGRDAQNRALPDGSFKASLEVTYDTGVASQSNSVDVELDSTPPQLAFDVNPKIYRPGNQSAILIPANFALAARDKHNIGAWSMEIRNEQGLLHRAFNGQGDPPATLTWDGMSTQGQPAQSGKTYIARFFSRDTLGNKSESQPLAQIVLMKEIQFVMKADALFEVGKADVRISAYKELKEMKEKILTYVPKGGQVSVVGHSDNIPVSGVGQYKSNEELSYARAQAVIKFFTTLLGMDPKMFVPVGGGDKQPIATNDTPEGREANRRVEIKIRGTAYQ